MKLSCCCDEEHMTINMTCGVFCFFFHHRVVLLLLSSGYIGLRIVALEKQLTSLGALPEFSLRSGYEFLSLEHTPRAVKGKPKALE